MKPVSILLLSTLFVFAISCSSSSVEEDSPAEDSLIFKNELMSCFNVSTKAEDMDVLVTLANNPELAIYVTEGRNTRSGGDDYDYTAYFVNDGELEGSVNYSVATQNNEVILSYSVGEMETDTIILTTIVSERKMGQYVAECLQDAYSNHGWASVFATIATAYCPYVMAGLFGGCVSRYFIEG